MKPQRYRLVLALSTLILAALACASGEPTLGNVRTAHDQDGIQLSHLFAKTDTVYVVSDLTNGAKGNRISSKWYAEKVKGIEPDFLLGSDEIQIPEAGPYTLHFDFPAPTGGWLTGEYKVEVYFNGAL